MALFILIPSAIVFTPLFRFQGDRRLLIYLAVMMRPVDVAQEAEGQGERCPGTELPPVFRSRASQRVVQGWERAGGRLGRRYVLGLLLLVLVPRLHLDVLQALPTFSHLQKDSRKGI